MRKFLSIVLCFIIFEAKSQSNEASIIAPLINQYQADKQMHSRKFALKQSDEYYTRMQRFYADWSKKLKQQDFKNLTTNEQVDYLLLQRDLKADTRALNKNSKEFQMNKFALPFAKIIVDFEQKRRVGKQQNGDSTAKQFESLITQIDDSKIAIEKDKLALTAQQAYWAQQTINQYLLVFTESFKFYDGYDPQFTQATKTVYPKVLKSLKEYYGELSKKAKLSNLQDDGTGIIGNPIGRDALLDLLGDEMIAYTPEQIEKIALREFAWCDEEMLKASKEMGFGTDWKKALEKVKNDYPELGKQPELVYFLANEAIDFVEKNKLIDVPEAAKEGWRMRMLSPEEQKFAPFFLGGESVLIAYPTEDMSEDAKMMTLRGNNRHFSRAVVFHELIPGHNLQYFVQSRYKPYRRVFGTPFWTEGWSLYWEMLLWDKNFAKTPEDKIGMLFWRMHRCARIIFSMNYHLGKWTPKQCIDFLVDRVGFERANAEAEVRRSFTGGYGPLYQIGYMLGGLQFRALHKELVQSGKMSNIQFHDRILKENSMPVEMVRAILTKKILTKEYRANWKFAGKIE